MCSASKLLAAIVVTLTLRPSFGDLANVRSEPRAANESPAADPLFASMVTSCWKFGQSDEPTRAARFDRLVASIRGQTG
jgi:hypothetical protein